MNNILFYLHLAVSVLLIILIALQQRGSSLGSAFGGGGQVYSTKRGVEKKLYYATIVLATAFLILGALNLFT
jgi:preprotein translocase subunit SecG